MVVEAHASGSQMLLSLLTQHTIDYEKSLITSDH